MAIAAFGADLILACSGGFRQNGRGEMELCSRFKIRDMSELHFVPGMGVEQDKSYGTFKLQQTQYVERMLQTFKNHGMQKRTPYR